MSTFRLSFRLLDSAFHGRRDGGDPEWPPSPLRAFQALVCAAAGRWRSSQFECYACPALEWLETLSSPEITAPVGRMSSSPYRLYVPNNAADVVAASWVRGNQHVSIAEHRTEKDVRPTRFAEGQPVHYDWPLTAEQLEKGKKTYEGTLQAAARSITHLGWGVDQAVGHAELLAADLPADPTAERWLPTDGDTPLRVPRDGTLADLRQKHAAFLGRLGPKGFTPVPPLTAFRVVGYRRAAEPTGRPWAAFELLKPDADEGGRLSRDPVRGTRDVAAWVRHAVAEVCRDWPTEYGSIEQFVHGHDGPDRPVKGDGADRRFQYLPLPTINPALGRVESIRRVLVAAPPGCEPQIAWLKQRLSGRPLVRDGEVVGLLNRLPDDDWVRRQYTRPARVWTTVSPVIWPGHDDHDVRKAERILRTAFAQAGLPREVVAGIAELDWRPVGYRAGVDLAVRYVPPDQLGGRRSHVRVRFARPVPGPLAVGAGRYRGFGLLVADEG
jgi:CRISPR-associated protein Csb2